MERCSSGRTADVLQEGRHMFFSFFFLIRAPDSFSFCPIALADVNGHVASDEFLRRPRQCMCPAGSGFRQFERWEWIWTLLKRSRCTVSFPLKKII